MRITRRTALLLAPIGVAVGNAILEAIHRTSLLAARGDTTTAMVVMVAVLTAAAISLAHSSGVGREGFARQLAAHGVLLAGIEALEFGAATPGLLAGPSLHDPMVSLGLACQLIAAVIVHSSARLVIETARRMWTHFRILAPRPLPLDAITTADAGHGNSAAHSPIVGRAPPTGRALWTARS